MPIEKAPEDEPSYPDNKGNVALLVKEPRFNQKEKVCLVVLVGELEKVLLKYALADERKRSELLMVYAVAAEVRRSGLTSFGRVMVYPMLRIEVTVMLVDVRTV